MADVNISSTCSSLDTKTNHCTFTGKTCPFAQQKNYRECYDATFCAHVSMPPDQFYVLLDRDHRPTVGTLPMKRCNVIESHKAAGAHVNAILETVGREALLEMKYHLDGRIEFYCEKTETGLIWKDGRFSPAF